MGVGDLGVGKQIKKMGAAFYGRMDAYDRALDAGSDEAVLASMIDIASAEPMSGAEISRRLRDAHIGFWHSMRIWRSARPVTFLLGRV